MAASVKKININVRLPIALLISYKNPNLFRHRAHRAHREGKNRELKRYLLKAVGSLG